MSTGYATCPHCGASIQLYTIFNREMQGLANSWRNKHARACEKRTPQQRTKWALKEANKQHGIAYRRLLTIGVKRGGK